MSLQMFWIENFHCTFRKSISKQTLLCGSLIYIIVPLELNSENPLDAGSIET